MLISVCVDKGGGEFVVEKESFDRLKGHMVAYKADFVRDHLLTAAADWEDKVNKQETRMKEATAAVQRCLDDGRGLLKTDYGILKVRVHEATGFPPSTLLAKRRASIGVSIGNLNYRTPKSRESKPVWESDFHFSLRERTHRLKVEALGNDGLGGIKLYGDVSIPLASLEIGEVSVEHRSQISSPRNSVDLMYRF